MNLFCHSVLAAPSIALAKDGFGIQSPWIPASARLAGTLAKRAGMTQNQSQAKQTNTMMHHSST